VISAAAISPTDISGVISFASPQVFGPVDALKAARAMRVPALLDLGGRGLAVPG
jgi:hypothetical protein